MKKSLLVCGLCWAMVFSTAVTAQTPTPSTDWDNLRRLAIGEKIAVEKKDGKKLTGKNAGVSDVELVLERKKKPKTIARDQVRKVWRIAPPNQTKKTVYGSLGFAGGLLAGVTIAVGLGFKECGGSCADEGTGIVAALIGLPVAGVLAGRALAGNGKRTLIYSAP
ncbi:MAG TPA: hypothetical protein PLD20_19095 [Blastocatellia bacterium]|nr:hypothetical protein [Blastocatellia bacterium]HMV86388.1 hypothetical protein [Blastocatellia bacterium]HMY76718.1 hypothetical protein [Blastocatellia bacterium]HMZ20053.1 hypothetical protein [Blastocatellia bacterium]HNG33320.1 hypothetical protein [Blastocatellia bacterium]